MIPVQRKDETAEQFIERIKKMPLPPGYPPPPEGWNDAMRAILADKEEENKSDGDT